MRYRSDDVDFSGWITPASLGTTYTKTDTSAPDEDSVWIARRNTKLLRTPGGKRLAIVEKDAAVRALRSRASGGELLVEYQPMCVDDYAFVGFVPRKDLFQPNYGVGYGCGRGGGYPLPQVWGDAESATRVPVEAGRFLLDPDASVVVGCVLRDAEMADLGEGRLAVPTIWGPIPVRLAPQGFGDACGTGT